MKTMFLWLIAFFILIQSYVAVETIPEFHVLTSDEYVKQMQEFSKLNLPAASNIGSLETHEYHNGKVGQYLCMCVLITDFIIFVLLILALIDIRKTCKGASSYTGAHK
jgi:hypothetical protein